MILTPTKVFIDENKIIIRSGDGTVVYKSDINSFEENSGVTIHNVEFSSLEAYYLRLKSINKNFACGEILDTILLAVKMSLKNQLLIIDFDEVEDVSESFFKAYTKFLLETPNKIITINMNTDISNRFSSFISINIPEIDEG